MPSLRFCYNLGQRERTKSYVNRLLLLLLLLHLPPSRVESWRILLLFEQLETGLQLIPRSSPGASTSLSLLSSLFCFHVLSFYFLSLLSSLFCLLVLSFYFLSLLGSNFAWTFSFSLSLFHSGLVSLILLHLLIPIFFTPPSLSLQEFGPCSLLTAV